MQQEIGDAIQLLESARSVPAEDAVDLVNKAVELLVTALKDNQGFDVDKGGGS